MTSKNIPPSGPGPTKAVLNKIFQVVINETANNPANILTRHKLQLQVPIYPDTTVLGCLMTYQHDGHIACCRNGVDITPVNMNKDYEEFHLTTFVSNQSGVYT